MRYKEFTNNLSILLNTRNPKNITDTITCEQLQSRLKHYKKGDQQPKEKQHIFAKKNARPNFLG